MCGLAGFRQLDRPLMLPQDERVLRAMVRTLAHRGPDDEALWWDAAAGLALGFRRLAVLDPSPAARQPMVSACGRYVLAFNGEIYNYRELRRELEARGHHFRSQGDSEVLLEACAHFGLEATLERISGMFAFALWDRRTRRLALVRDRLGKKPLYWARLGEVLLFASEPRAFFPHPAFRPARAPEAVALYLHFGYVPSPRSIFRGVHRLAPGTMLVLEADGRIRQRRWFDLVAEAEAAAATPFAAEDAELEEAFADLLADAVRRRLVADVPVGLFLSGGIDSSLMATLAADAAPDLAAFTLGFEDPAFDEGPQAAAIARALGLPHHLRRVDPERLPALVEALPAVFDEPFADASALPTLQLCRFARERVVVALAGDGGDELFGGYRHYADAMRLHRRLRLLPRPLHQLARRALTLLDRELVAELGRRLPALARLRLDERAAKLAEVLGAAPETVMRLVVAHHPSPEALYPLARGTPPAGFRAGVSRRIRRLPERLQLLDQLTWLPDDILVKVDRTSMSCGLEVRAPLLDERVVRFVWRLPPRLRHRGREGKVLLRRLLARRLPPQLWQRPKRGFSPPLHRWLRGPLRPLVEELLEPESLRAAGPFQVARVRRLWREHREGLVDRRFELWNLLVYLLWYRRVFGAGGGYAAAARPPAEVQD